LCFYSTESQVCDTEGNEGDPEQDVYNIQTEETQGSGLRTLYQ